MIMDSPAAEQTLDERDADTMDTSDNGFEEQHDNDMLEEESDNNIEQVALSWRGHSRTDLHAMWLRAKECRNAGQVNEAEHLLQQTFLGLSHVIGKTNEDTMKVVYTLADLYADSDRMEKAITLIEEAVQTHINTWGYENRQTQQCVLHAVEILNGWNRQGDAIGLLSLCHELLHSHASIHHTLKPENGGRANGKSGLKSITNGPGTNLARVTESILEDLSSSSVNYGLQVARAHVTAKDRAAENLLFAMIEQCHGRSDLNIQNLKAHGELLKLFEKLGVAEDQKHHFYIAFDALTEAWDAYEWEEHKIESLDFMEASLQLLANALKCGYRVETKRSFRNAADQASEVFGFDDERTVWVLITIGLVYQTHLTWDDAEEWFEEAFSAAIANEEWGPKDGIVMSLQNAMDHQHFSYLSDEGRPFKTIFGVSGIKISPGRLHLE